jgi:hypothetical protein
VHYMAATTTICIEPGVKDILTNLKRHPRESYNSVVARLTDLASNVNHYAMRRYMASKRHLKTLNTGACTPKKRS